jgi:hypothetical protein
MPGWYQPDDTPKTEPPHTTSSSSGTSATGENASSGGTRSKRTYWPPRQCRICLETVQPTFNIPSESLPGFLQSPNVVYEDESGRLIRPCMCKGSSKYVHEACLQAWRHADPGYGRRNYWQCPTCGFKYRLARMGVGRFIGSVCKSFSFTVNTEEMLIQSKAAQIGLTAIILIMIIFVLGFVADPIINLYLDPWSFIPGLSGPEHTYYYEDDSSTWYEHFAKGFASMGVLGFLKVLIASPLSYFRIGGGRGRTTGRDRYEQVSWIIIAVGVGTFLAVCIVPFELCEVTNTKQAIYKGVRVWSRRTLERAGERVMDVQGDNDDDDDE